VVLSVAAFKGLFDDLDVGIIDVEWDWVENGNTTITPSNSGDNGDSIEVEGGTDDGDDLGQSDGNEGDDCEEPDDERSSSVPSRTSNVVFVTVTDTEVVNPTTAPPPTSTANHSRPPHTQPPDSPPPVTTQNATQSHGGGNAGGGDNNGNTNGEGDTQGMVQGIGTWYTQDDTTGACGIKRTDGDKVIALYTELYNDGTNCGRFIELIDIATGNNDTAIVGDECPGCGPLSANHLDLSLALYDSLGESRDVGTIKIMWKFVP